jgi:hypothetical protein
MPKSRQFERLTIIGFFHPNATNDILLHAWGNDIFAEFPAKWTALLLQFHSNQLNGVWEDVANQQTVLRQKLENYIFKLLA